MTRFFLILCFFIFSVFSLSAQYGGSRSMINYLYHKAKPYYFGISLGYDNSNLFLKKSNYFVD